MGDIDVIGIGGEVETNAILVAVMRLQIRDVVERHREGLFRALMSEGGLVADEASKVATIIVRVALELEAERFVPSEPAKAADEVLPESNPSD